MTTTTTDPEEDQVPVVIKQKLLSVEEVFVYRIPKLGSSAGYRAEDWDLAKPLQTCSLVVEQSDDTCYIRLLSKKPNPDGGGAMMEVLFALAIIRLEGDVKLQQFVESVVDSSRYFVVRISDAKTNRSATIGVGFRERDDASNFRMALQDYERSMQRQQQAQEMHEKYEHTTEAQVSDIPEMSNLSLKEGETIHVELKGKPVREKKTSTSKPSSGALPLLKKPPPSPAVGTKPQQSSVKLDFDRIQDEISDVDSSNVGSDGAVEGALTDDEDWNEVDSSAAGSRS